MGRQRVRPEERRKCGKRPIPLEVSRAETLKKVRAIDRRVAQLRQAAIVLDPDNKYRPLRIKIPDAEGENKWLREEFRRLSNQRAAQINRLKLKEQAATR